MLNRELQDHTLRLSQTISTFGVGAICVIRGESFVGLDTGRWRVPNTRIDGMTHFAETLGVDHFRTPPTKSLEFGERSDSIPYYRFPRWLFCMSCRKLTRWRFQDDRQGTPPTCDNCRRNPVLTPMRFIQICANGHMGDIPWDRWAHLGGSNFSQRGCQDTSRLEFRIRRNTGGGLESLVVYCVSCKNEQSLQGITGDNSMARVGMSCPGTQPWENTSGGNESCTESLHVVQSGAGNVYFPHVPSAIDIPPEANFDHYSDNTTRIKSHEAFDDLSDLYTTGPDNLMIPRLVRIVSRGVGCTEDEVYAVLKVGSAGTPPTNFSDSKSSKDLLEGEWLAFVTPQTEAIDERDHFINRPVVPPASISLKSLDDRLVTVTQATKLREVRALAGFSRYERTIKEGQFIPAYLKKQLPWLPAIEVFGEGIFISIDPDLLKIWEATPEILNKSDILIARKNASFRADWLPTPNPRFLMLHTLSHLLLRQLCYECGYSSSAVRERIYCSDQSSNENMAGILLYTADGDSEGTLGGLVRQALPENLERLIVNALDKASWCSNDPICSESSGQGVDALNLAACHACALVPETSCPYGNCLLDRSQVLSTIGDVPGFFDPVLTESISRPPRNR